MKTTGMGVRREADSRKKNGENALARNEGECGVCDVKRKK